MDRAGLVRIIACGMTALCLGVTATLLASKSLDGRARRAEHIPASSPHVAFVAENVGLGTTRSGARLAEATPVPRSNSSRDMDVPFLAPLDTSNPRSLSITFAAGRKNAFFDERRFVSLISDDGSLPRRLLAELSRTEAISSLSTDMRFMRDTPPEVLERMAMVDLLATIAEGNADALDDLVTLALTPIPHDLPPQAIRVLVGEKYDAFLELARLDWPTATATYEKLPSSALRSMLIPALIGGLEASGASREEALRMTETL